MIQDRLATLLAQVAAGALAPAAALDQLRHFPFESLGYARVDHLRPLVQGHAEVVLCQGKTPDQVAGICRALARASGSFLATRAPADVATVLLAEFPGARYNELARTVHLPSAEPCPTTGRGTILIVTAGTGDLPVAEEAGVVAEALGNRVARLTDVGVAGIHRLMEQRAILADAAVIIVVAGMDGALPSVMGGLVPVPVIAVPTSVGYGASFGGLAALLTMLNSCAAGVTVVNIDNGFGAAAAASRINHLPAGDVPETA